jgi:hypothetical protein
MSTLVPHLKQRESPRVIYSVQNAGANTSATGPLPPPQRDLQPATDRQPDHDCSDACAPPSPARRLRSDSVCGAFSSPTGHPLCGQG